MSTNRTTSIEHLWRFGNEATKVKISKLKPTKFTILEKRDLKKAKILK